MVGTSIVIAWSLEVVGVDRVNDVVVVLTISLVEVDSIDVTVFGGV